MSNCNCDPNKTHGTGCPIIREFRMSPEQRKEAYREELRARLAELEGERSVDVPYRLQKLGVPHDEIAALRSPTQTKAIEWAKKFILSPKEQIRTLVLAGPRGVGKSVGAAWVLGDWVKHHDWNNKAGGGRQFEPAAWVNAREVTSETDFGKVNPDWLEGLQKAQMLVVDDIGKDATPTGLVALRDLLTARHEARRRTVITSNLEPLGLRERYGEAWFDRMKSASIVPDLSNEKSMRRRAA